MERKIIKTYSGEEWLIIGETIGTNDSYPIYAIPSAPGRPHHGAGNYTQTGIEICRSCGALRSKVSQSTGNYYCERLCWTLVDREDKHGIDQQIYLSLGLEMEKVDKTSDRGELYQSYPQIPDDIFLGMSKEEGKKFILLIKNYPEEAKDILRKYNIKFKK